LTVTEPSGAATTTPREVFRRLQRQIREKGGDGFPDRMAVDGVVEWPFAGPGAPRRLEGREAIRSFVGGSRVRVLQLDELRSVAVHETHDPEVIVIEVEAHGRVVATDRPVQLSAIVVMQVRNGEIVSYRDYTNPLAAAEAAGRVPELIAALSPAPAP
jgi:ketosteroid isomerase-like protein